MEGNHRSAELCRKLLAQQALVYGLSQEVSVKPSNMGVVEVDPDRESDDEDLDVLERMRRDRARTMGA